MAAFAPGPVPIATRRGKDFVIPRGASLPANCVKCGAAAQRRWRKKFYWHSSGWYLLVILNLLIYILVALLVRKKMELNIPLCEIHDRERRRYGFLALIMLVLCVPLGVAMSHLFRSHMESGWIMGSVMFFVGVAFVYLCRNYLHARHVDDRGSSIRGAKEPFLQLLPPAF